MRDLVPRQLLPHLPERVRSLCRIGKRTRAQHPIWLRADETVASEPLAAFDGLEEEGMFAASHLQEGGYRCFQIGRYVLEHRHEVVLPPFGELEYRLEIGCVVHFAPNTSCLPRK